MLRFVVVSSEAGSIGGLEHNFPLTAYGASKAAEEFYCEADALQVSELDRFSDSSGASSFWCVEPLELATCLPVVGGCRPIWAISERRWRG